jgi:hypothetical protein
VAAIGEERSADLNIMGNRTVEFNIADRESRKMTRSPFDCPFCQESEPHAISDATDAHLANAAWHSRNIYRLGDDPIALEYITDIPRDQFKEKS